MSKTLRLRTLPEGPLPTLLSRACAGDVLSIPCLVYIPSDDVLGTHDFVSLYACVLVASHSRITLTRLYDQIGNIETRDTNDICNLSGRIPLFTEHGTPIAWHSNSACRLLVGRRKDLVEEYFESLESPSNDAH